MQNTETEKRLDTGRLSITIEGIEKTKMDTLTKYFGEAAICLVCSPSVVCLNCRLIKKEVSEMLKNKGLPHECAHGFLSQNAYNAVLGLAEAENAAALERARIMWPDSPTIEGMQANA